MTGFVRYVGVSYSQDTTGEFIGAFLIPSIAHQDPHYHRMPTATIKRRIAHCLYQVLWTQGDNGKGMVNYADLAGFAIDDGIGNLYVPGQRTNLPSTAERYGIGLATAPIENVHTAGGGKRPWLRRWTDAGRIHGKPDVGGARVGRPPP